MMKKKFVIVNLIIMSTLVAITFTCLAIFTLSDSTPYFLGYASLRSTPVNLVLNGDNGLSNESYSEEYNVINDYTTIHYSNAKSLENGHCTLEKGATIQKVQASRQINSVTVTFTTTSGKLFLHSAYTSAFEEGSINHAELTSGTAFTNLVGNYWKLEASEDDVNITSIIITYECHIPDIDPGTSSSAISALIPSQDDIGVYRYNKDVFMYIGGTFDITNGRLIKDNFVLGIDNNIRIPCEYIEIDSANEFKTVFNLSNYYLNYQNLYNLYIGEAKNLNLYFKETQQSITSDYYIDQHPIDQYGLNFYLEKSDYNYTLMCKLNNLLEDGVHIDYYDYTNHPNIDSYNIAGSLKDRSFVFTYTNLVTDYGNFFTLNINNPNGYNLGDYLNLSFDAVSTIDTSIILKPYDDGGNEIKDVFTKRHIDHTFTTTDSNKQYIVLFPNASGSTKSGTLTITNLRLTKRALKRLNDSYPGIGTHTYSDYTYIISHDANNNLVFKFNKTTLGYDSFVINTGVVCNLIMMYI